MKIGRKAFLSRNPDDLDYIAWSYVRHGAMPDARFVISHGRITTSLHTPSCTTIEIDAVMPAFIAKLELLSQTLKAAATHVTGHVVHHHKLLNPPTREHSHMTGYVAWGDDGENYYVTMGDCHRAWRMQVAYEGCGNIVRIHQRKLMVIVRHLDQAIKELKNV